MPTTAPLFHPSYDELLASLGLSGVKDKEIHTTVDSAVRFTRADLWRRLGLARVQELQAMDHVEQPKTESNHLRTMAEELESLLIRQRLVSMLTPVFLEGGGRGIDEFEDLPLIRQLSGYSKRQEREALQEQIDNLLEILTGEEEAGEDNGVRSFLSPSGGGAGPRTVGSSIY